MKTKLILAATVIAAIGICSCGKKEKHEDIIIDKVIDKPVEGIKTAKKPPMSDAVKWLGSTYSYSISYEVLDTVPPVENFGEKYHDNAANLKIKRQDGSEVCSKRISKSSFSGFLSKDMKEHGVFLGMVFDKADSNNLYFVASIGSPDETNEDFVMCYYIIDRNGNSSVATYNAPTARE